MKDIILTWPKGKQLQAYLDELERAEREGLVINFRVKHPPKDAIVSGNQVSVDFRGAPHKPKCYMVYDGFIRGYNDVLGVAIKGSGIVTDVDRGGHWPAGWYIARDPHWNPIDPLIPMRGFQGFRYAEGVV